MNKQPAVTEATRQRFIDVFCELYRSRPIARITVKEISERAGYNRSTFYQYFSDVYAIEETIENAFIQRFFSLYASTMPIDLNTRTLSSDFFKRYTRFLEENLDMAMLLFCNPHNNHFASRLKDKAQPLMMNLLKIPADNHPARYACDFYLSGIIAVVKRWLSHPHELSVDDLYQLVKGILEDGILAQL